MQIEKLKTAQLIPADYNPRKDLKPGDPEYEKLKRSIEQFGYVDLLIWNKTTEHIVGGHQRAKILMDLGYDEVDCVVVRVVLGRHVVIMVGVLELRAQFFLPFREGVGHIFQENQAQHHVLVNGCIQA